MATKIKKIRCAAYSASLAPNGWVEVGKKVVYGNGMARVTGIEAGEEGSYIIHMVDATIVNYDSQGIERPIFAVNAMAPADPEVFNLTVTDVVAVETEEVEEEQV